MVGTTSKVNEIGSGGRRRRKRAARLNKEISFDIGNASPEREIVSRLPDYEGLAVYDNTRLVANRTIGGPEVAR